MIKVVEYHRNTREQYLSHVVGFRKGLDRQGGVRITQNYTEK